MPMIEEAKEIITMTFGPINARKLDEFDSSDSKKFLDQCNAMISVMLGEEEGKKLLAPLYKKYT
jgi:hypothetical protein